MKKSTQNTLIWSSVALATVTAAGAISHYITTYLLKIAMDRRLPKSANPNGKMANRLQGSPRETAFFADIAQAKERLEALPREDLTLTCDDGTCLVGHFVPAEHPQRTIVAMHGWRSEWSHDFALIADFWRQNGCNVLYAEQRGQNNSGGDYIGFGLLERYDCRDWVNLVNARYGSELPIYLCGISMGATTVLMTAGLSLPSNVQGIIADCGFTSPHAIWKHITENNLRLSYGIRAGIADKICQKKIRMGSRSYSTVEAMKNCHIPVLFIHGTDDAFVPVTMTYENYKACIAPRHLLVVPGAEHGMSYFVDRESYEAAVLAFFELYDAPEAQPKADPAP